MIGGNGLENRGERLSGDGDGAGDGGSGKAPCSAVSCARCGVSKASSAMTTRHASLERWQTMMAILNQRGTRDHSISLLLRTLSSKIHESKPQNRFNLHLRLSRSRLFAGNGE